MKKMILGLFYVLAMMSSTNAKAKTTPQELALNPNNRDTIQNNMRIAGCAFDNQESHQNMMNRMHSALVRQYAS